MIARLAAVTTTHGCALRWHVRWGDEALSGHDVAIVGAIAGLRGALRDLAASAQSPEVEGEINGPHAGPMPFWIRWGYLAPADRLDPGRDVSRARSCIDLFIGGLRDELHRAADAHVLTQIHPAT